MRKVKIRSRLLVGIGAVFALALLLGAAVLKIKTNNASAESTPADESFSLVLGSTGSVSDGAGSNTNKFVFKDPNTGQILYEAYCASGNNTRPGFTTQNVKGYHVNAQSDPNWKMVKYFKIMYYGKLHGYSVAAIHWALTYVNFDYVPESGTASLELYNTYVMAEWPEDIASGVVLYLDFDGTGMQSIAAIDYDRTRKKNLTVNKEWLDANGQPEADGVAGKPTEVGIVIERKKADGTWEEVETATLKASEDWTKTFEVDDGYEYRVRETWESEDYTTYSQCSGNGCTITNTRLGSVLIRIRKTWDDYGYEDNRPDKLYIDVTCKLEGSNEADPDCTRTWYLAHSTYGDKDVWSAQISGLPKSKEVDGQVVNYVYTVAEHIDYTDGHNETIYLYVEDEQNSSVSRTGDVIMAEFENDLPMISIPLTKVWDDHGFESQRPAYVWYRVYRVNGDGTESFVTNGTFWNPDWDDETTEAGNTWLTNIELPKYDKDRNEIQYRIEEYTTSKYESERVDEDNNDNNGVTIKNTRLKEARIIKCWANDDVESRPESIKFNLFGTVNGQVEGYGEVVELTAEDEVTDEEDDDYGCWRKKITGLPARTTSGEELTYITMEQETDDDRYEVDLDSCEFNAENNYTCKFVNNRVIAVNVFKIWQQDDPKNRPEYIEVTLYKDGKAVGDPVRLSADNDWSYAWTGLDYGHKYTVTENIQVPKYKPGAYAYETDDDGNVYVRIYNAPDTLGVKIGKYVFTITGVLLGGAFITRKLVARR